jgi:diguanylate cyclase (GGDEF)-like protein
MTAVPPLGSPPSSLPELAEADHSALLRPARRVLMATISSARLITLELQVCGVPQLSLLARSGSSSPVDGLALWPTCLGGNAWYDGMLLVATAPRADAERRVAVHGAATLLADLLTSERRRLSAELLASRAVEMAGVDALTGVGNRRTWRRALDEEAARAARYERSSALVVVDLDGLKRINDEQGHAAGDGYLQRAAAAVRAASRSVDVVCRLGGDEFGVLAPETGADGAARLASRLREHLDAAGVQASLGVATATDGDLERAWHRADSEMYLHKRSRATV